MRNPTVGCCRMRNCAARERAEVCDRSTGWEQLRRDMDRLRRKEAVRKRKRAAAVSAVAGVVAAAGIFSAGWAGIMYALMREWSHGEDPAAGMIKFMVIAAAVAVAGLGVKVVTHYVQSRTCRRSFYDGDSPAAGQAPARGRDSL